jgi:hypothetical protein
MSKILDTHNRGHPSLARLHIRKSLFTRWRTFSFLERNVRNVARIKLGYYPLPQEEAKRLRKLLEFSARTTSVVDPCVGTGVAPHQLTDGAEAQKYGVELDANRAVAAATSGITTIRAVDGEGAVFVRLRKRAFRLCRGASNQG